MNVFFKLVIFYTVFFSLASCTSGISLDNLDFECGDPKSTLLSGNVIDNYTSMPIENTNINFTNYTHDAEETNMTIESDQSGDFSYFESGCSFREEVLDFNSASHPDYDGHASSSFGNSQTSSIRVLMFKKFDFKLIFNNTNLFDIDELYYSSYYCINPTPTCHRFSDSDRFVPTELDTVIVEVAEGEMLTIRYRIDDQPFVQKSVSTDGIDEFVIEY